MLQLRSTGIHSSQGTLMSTAPAPTPPTELQSLLAGTCTESGANLLDLSLASPTLLIFLRHFGCPFARQAIADVAEIQGQLAAQKVRPVFIHLADPELARNYFNFYGLSAVERVADPNAKLYHAPAFALAQQNPIWHLLNPGVWYGWLRGALFRHGMGRFQGDGSQMPGVFFLRDASIARRFRHNNIAARPDYLKLCR